MERTLVAMIFVSSNTLLTPFSDDRVLLCLLNSCLPSFSAQFWLFCQSQCIPGNLVLTSHLRELGIQIPRPSVQKVAGTYRGHRIGVWSNFKYTHMAAICLRKKPVFLRRSEVGREGTEV